MQIIRRFLDAQLALVAKGKPLERMRPLVSALDSFFFEPSIRTKSAPHIRDAVDLKRWMMIVVFALVPCILMSVWNSGIQKLVYVSGDYKLMNEFISSSHSLSGYFSFCMKDGRWQTILEYGLSSFIPVMIISYMAGGIAEGICACVRKHEIAEGFLVSGMLFALILPPTIPYWMVALGVIAGIILSKEIFGGTGMNIVNPAMTCRLLLFFTFPGQMSGDVWAGTNPVVVRESLIKMNKDAGLSTIDGYTQATSLAKFNIGLDIKRIHVDTIGASLDGDSGNVTKKQVLDSKFDAWAQKNNITKPLHSVSRDTLKNYLTDPISQQGLGLSPENFESAYRFATLEYEVGMQTNWNLFLGNKLGSFGETSILACLLGAFILIFAGVGSWRTMAGMILGAFITAWTFKICTQFFGSEGGIWSPAVFTFPPYKHLLMGSLVFGAVFMATDPVSSPALRAGRWIYGFMIGMLVVVIRSINPAYAEAVMLATITGNVFAPFIDHYAALFYRRRALSYA